MDKMLRGIADGSGGRGERAAGDLIEVGDLARVLVSPTECRECTRQAGMGSSHRLRCASHGSSSSATKCIRCRPREAIGADHKMPIFAPMTGDELQRTRLRRGAGIGGGDGTI
jgi:hypothetical protein